MTTPRLLKTMNWKPFCKLARKHSSVAVFLIAGMALHNPLHAQPLHPERAVSGTVTDPGHEPLRGAVVQLQNEETQAVTTYLSDANGHFLFKHVGADMDYRVFAIYRTHHSKSHEISKFNSKPNLTFTLVIRPD